jgi:hypothetical protein
MTIAKGLNDSEHFWINDDHVAPRGKRQPKFPERLDALSHGGTALLEKLEAIHLQPRPELVEAGSTVSDVEFDQLLLD